MNIMGYNELFAMKSSNYQVHGQRLIQWNFDNKPTTIIMAISEMREKDPKCNYKIGSKNNKK